MRQRNLLLRPRGWNSPLAKAVAGGRETSIAVCRVTDRRRSVCSEKAGRED